MDTLLGGSFNTQAPEGRATLRWENGQEGESMLRGKRKSTLLREGRHYAYSMDTPKGDCQQGRRENRHYQSEDLHSKKTINTLERELTIIFGLKALANKDTLLPTQMFPRLPARSTFVADTNFVSGTQKMFLILFRNIL